MKNKTNYLKTSIEPDYRTISPEDFGLILDLKLERREHKKFLSEGFIQ